MRIDTVETFVVGNPPPSFGGQYFVFVKLTTGDGVVGYGGKVLFRSLSVGEHQLTVNVPDGDGGHFTATTEIMVTPRRVHSTYHRHGGQQKKGK